MLGLGLISNGLHSILQGLFVEKVVILDWDKILIKLVDKRASGWDVVLDDVNIVHLAQVLHDGS